MRFCTWCHQTLKRRIFRSCVVLIFLTAFARADTGDLFLWGRNREGQLGIGSTDKSSSVPVKVIALEGERIETAALGSNHVLAVTKQGTVYQWGKLHRCGTMDNRQWDGLSVRMTGLAEGEDESSARKRRLLDRSHQAYYSNKGGRGTTEEATEHEANRDFGNFAAYLQRTPLLMDELLSANVRITRVAAGYGFSVLVSDEGQVWSLGINEKFQLGLGHRFNQDKPQLVKALIGQARIKDVACGQQHVLALDDEDKVWSWGLGVFGQLGHSSLRDEPLPRRLMSFSVKDEAVQVDDGDVGPVQVPTHIQEASKTIRIIQIVCGSHHSLALDSEGRIWSWGSSEYGQQGGSKNYEDLGARGHSKEQHFYYSIPRLLLKEVGLNGKRPVKLAAGNLHNIALTEDGSMFTWGWGQTGALGHGNRRFQLYPTVINSLRGDPIRCIAGGARTSFAVTSGTSTSFAFDFQPWINNPQYSDLTIHLARNKSLHAHQVLVFSRCPALRAAFLFSRRFGSAPASNELRFPSVDPLVFQGLLAFLYTDHLRVAPHMVRRLAVLALRLRLPRLVALCERYLSLEEGAERDPDHEDIVVPHSTWEQDMQSAINESAFSDYKLSVDSQEFHAHRVILHARCDYFSTMFTSAFHDSTTRELELTNLSQIQLMALLVYLYTNSVDHVDSDNIVEVLHSSDRFLIEDLKQAIELKLEEAVDDESVVDALLISESTATPRLRNACFSRIIANLDAFKSSTGLAKLREALPTTLRELDFIASKRGLISDGGLIRCH